MDLNSHLGSLLESWPLELQFKDSGANLSRIRVYHDFTWNEYLKHGRVTFRGGKSLTQKIRDKCPTGKTPALLLTSRKDKFSPVLESSDECIAVIGIDDFLRGDWWDPLAAYMATTSGASLSKLAHLSDSNVENATHISTSDQQDTGILNDLALWLRAKPEGLEEIIQVVRALFTGDLFENSGTIENAAIETHAGRVRIVKKLLEANHGQQIWEVLVEGEPDLASKLALSRIYHDRKRVVDDFAGNIGKQMGEVYWQKLLEGNRWIFGTCYVGFVEERRIGIQSTLDHPLIGEDGFLEIVEIKKPDFPFWAHAQDGSLFNYRNKYLVPYRELQGAISQGANYILELEKQMDSKSYGDSHGGIYPLKPRCLIVHGRSNDWGEQESRDFRLLNDRLHGITVITFDHLLSRARQALDLLKA